MQSIIFLVGASGSGKTTLIPKLYHDLLSDLPMMPVTAVTVSTDDILEQWAERSGASYQEAFLEHAEAAAEAMIDKLEVAVSRRNYIIVDQRNMTVAQRAERMAYVPDNYRKIAITLEVPHQTLVDRIEERRKMTGKDTSSSVLEKQLADYERPSLDEGFDQVYIIENGGPSLKMTREETPAPGN